MATRITTIIPAYNATATLVEALDSIAEQTADVSNDVIVVDDGSTDGTAELAGSHGLSPRVIRTENRGASAALNTGIDAATGDFLCFLDADDLWTPAKLEAQLAALSADPAPDFVLGHSEAFECPTFAPEAFANLNYVKGNCPGYYCGALMVGRRSMLERFGLFDLGLRTGYFIEWFRDTRAKGAEYRMLDETVHRRRIRPQTLSRRTMEEGGKPDGLSRDFLEIARRSLQQKRQNS